MSDGASTFPNNETRPLDCLSPACAPAPSGASPAPTPRLPLPQALRPREQLALPDRARFRQHLEYRLAQCVGTPLALLYLDLEPQSAEPEGALERVLAQRLAHALRGDDVLGRMGPGQYACLLAGVPSRHALEGVAKRLCAALEAPLEIGSRLARVHAHIGIAVCPRDGATPGVLLKHADEATFRARAHAAGHAFFDPRLDP